MKPRLHSQVRSKPETSTPNGSPGLPSRRQIGRGLRWTASIGLLALFLLLITGGSVFAAVTPSNGVMVSAKSTLPRGAVFLNDANGGHWWISDQVLGICELVSQNVAGQPPFTTTACNGTAKAGGQIVVGDPDPALGLPAGTKFVYIADNASKSVNVVRFVFSPAGNGGFTTNVIWGVQNPTAVGGGSGGGRPVGLALAPHKGGGQDLYVGYLKSGDVMRIDKVQAIPSNSQPPAGSINKIGSTSDGRGVNALVLFGNDLYLAEVGGFGLSKIADPGGITRTACSAASTCTAVSVSPNPDFFPGGLATDWTSGPTVGNYIFIGDAQFGVTQSKVLRYDPSTGVADLYSQSINPSYTEGGITYTAYIGVLGLGYNPASQDLYVGDDPQFAAATPVLQQGHIWRVPHPLVAVIPAVTSIAPTSGTSLGGDTVTITGTNLATVDGAGAVTVQPTIFFGGNAANPVAGGVFCVSSTSCTAVSPAGAGTVDVRVTLAGQTSPITAADQFTYIAPATNAIAVTGIAPSSGATIGGTTVTITGQNLATYDPNTGAVTALPTINFGANVATGIACSPAALPLTLPVASTCTAISPAAAAGVVDVQATLNAQTSPTSPADQFTYITPTASLYAWGITAPKGGAVWLPGALGGHWWSSDHAQGFCRQDPMSTAPAAFNPGSTLHAINFGVCGDDLVGSAGQGVYDPRPVVNLATGAVTPFFYVYVPDNAVKSTAVWRLTLDPSTETMVPDPNGGAMATAMTPLADVRTLKPNGMALGPDGNLYVSDLVDPNIRQITNPNGDPRTQVISIVAVTGDNRGANGTQGFIGNLLYISGNRAAQFFDITKCPILNANGTTTACGMASVPAPTGVFVAGTATDPLHQLVYVASSPGAANATIYRYDASKDVYVAFPAGSVVADAFGVVTCPACTVGSQAVTYVTGGLLPPPGVGNGIVTCSLTCQRPWDQTNHPTAGILPGAPVPSTFAFAFGLGMDPSGNLAITEDPSAGARSSRGTMWIVPFIP